MKLWSPKQKDVEVVDSSDVREDDAHEEVANDFGWAHR